MWDKFVSGVTGMLALRASSFTFVAWTFTCKWYKYKSMNPDDMVHSSGTDNSVRVWNTPSSRREWCHLNRRPYPQELRYISRWAPACGADTDPLRCLWWTWNTFSLSIEIVDLIQVNNDVCYTEHPFEEIDLQSRHTEKSNTRDNMRVFSKVLCHNSWRNFLQLHLLRMRQNFVHQMKYFFPHSLHGAQCAMNPWAHALSGACDTVNVMRRHEVLRPHFCGMRHCMPYQLSRNNRRRHSVMVLMIQNAFYNKLHALVKWHVHTKLDTALCNLSPACY